MSPKREPVFLPPAMSVDDYDESKIRFPGVVQPKMDGCRVRVAKVDGKMYITSVNNIPRNWPSWEEQLYPVVPDNHVLEGEFYCRHDESKGHPNGQPISFQKLNGMFLRTSTSPSIKDVCMYAFDIFPILPDTPMKPYEMRMRDVEDIVRKHPFVLKYMPSTRVSCMEELDAVYDRIVDDMGYEGAVIRDPTGVYAGELSAMKRKTLKDEEYIVEGICIAGKRLRVSCKDMTTGRIFGAHWDPKPDLGQSTEEKVEEIYEQRETYVGKLVCVEYYLKTDDGIPRAAQVKGTRNDLDFDLGIPLRSKTSPEESPPRRASLVDRPKKKMRFQFTDVAGNTA
jgi:hypothetical protein